jgi:archaellum component FlaG (FlaF/FlaG flagellin family)
MMKKILSCICVVVILMSVVPVSVFATSSSDKTTEITSRLNEAFFVAGKDLYDVTFEGTVTDVATGSNDWICEAKVDKVISSGVYLEEGKTVHIVLSLSPCGTWDDVEEGDKIKVYGQFLPLISPQISVCGRSSYYLKKISSECLSISMLTGNLSISVWTDKSKYNIGETVTIYYKTNTACMAILTVTKPDGTQVVAGGPNAIPVCTGSKSAAAGYPTGTRTVTFEARTSYESDEATCYFDVVEEEKPDLIIQDISWNPYSPQKGDTVTFTVKIKNQGSGSAGSSTVKYYIDGSYVASDSVPSLSADSTSTQMFTWTVDKCGNVPIKAVADANNAVSESNEGNNERTETVSVECSDPDLIIQDISWSPGSPKQGDIITYTVTIKNQGSGSAGTSTAKYYVDGSYVASDSVPSLSAGSISTQTFTWTANKCENVQVKAVADANSEVSESNEGNNERTETVSITCNKPDLIIQDISWSPDSPELGDTITFTVTIKNIGEFTADPSTVKYYINNQYLDLDNIPGLSHDATSTQTFTWTVSSSGIVHVKAVADADNNVQECDELNNRRQESLHVGGSPPVFDTKAPAKPYPSVPGTHTGTITPIKDVINISKLYTYSCPGTGGHTEYAKIFNNTWNIETLQPWEGYNNGDWHILSFHDHESFKLCANNTYNYVIKTGSYPQIHHMESLLTDNGWINCSNFTDSNGKRYDDWIPAIRLFR